MSLSFHKKASALTHGFTTALMVLMLIGDQFLIGQPVKAETPQHRWAGDVPIMQSWQIEPELGFAFDSPEGRIVQVFATGPDDLAAVIAYYNDALSGLGWSGQGGRWNRGDEALTISQVKMATGMLWRIRLNPR